jgi:hypothetical protein
MSHMKVKWPFGVSVPPYIWAPEGTTSPIGLKTQYCKTLIRSLQSETFSIGPTLYAVICCFYVRPESKSAIAVGPEMVVVI